MSTTPTTSRKRLVALGAVTALAAGVLVPLAAAPASAAAVYSGASVPIRATLPAAPGSISLASTEALGQTPLLLPGDPGYVFTYYGLLLTEVPSGGTVNGITPTNPVGALQLPANDSDKTMSFAAGPLTFSVPGTYKFAVCRVVSDVPIGGTCVPGLPFVDPIVTIINVPVGGQIASFSVSPASQNAPQDTYTSFGISYKDGAGNPTLPLGNDTVQITLSNTSPLPLTPGEPFVKVNGPSLIALPPALLDTYQQWGDVYPAQLAWRMFQGGNRFDVALQQKAIAYFTVSHVVNNTIPSQTVSLNTGGQSASLFADVNLTKDFIVVDAGPAYQDIWLNTNINSVPISVYGSPGGVVQVSCQTFNNVDLGSAPTITVACPSAVTIEGDGEVSLNAVVAGAIKTGENFQVTFTSGAQVFTLYFTYRAPYPVPVGQTPPAGSTWFATGDNKVTVTTAWTDQYGNPWTTPQGVALFRVPSGSPIPGGQVLVDQGVTNAQGVSTLTTTPSSPLPAGESFYVAALTNGIPFPFPGVYQDLTKFNVLYNAKPVLTITKGVSTAGNQVTTQVPGDAYVDEDMYGPIEDWTPVTVQVTNNGAVVPFAAVSFSGSEGVNFVPFCNGSILGPSTPDVFPPNGIYLPGEAGLGLVDCFYGSSGGNFVPTTIPWNKGVAKDVVMADGNGKVSAQTYSTKTGNNTVTAAAGTGTTSGNWNVITQHWYLRNVSVAPATSTVKPGSFSTVTATGTDAFGNAVAAAPIQATIPASSIGRFDAGTKTTVQNTDVNGQAKFDITASASEVPVGTTKAATVQVGTNFCYGQSIGGDWVWNQLGALAEDLDHLCDGGWTDYAPGFKASSAPATATVTFDYAANGAIVIKSPKPGSPISSGGYFGVTAVATNIAAGTEVKLTLDGRAKADAKVAADGLIRFDKIPAQAGKYSVRWGTPGAYLYSNEVSLDIRPFGITRFNEGGTARDTFQVATGNWAKGTKIMLTKNGKAVASGRVVKVGEAIAIVYNAGPGTYQVRVDSNQGPVYGLAGGVVVIK